MTDTVALITGASRRLGRSAALHLASRGTNIIGTYKSSTREADAVRRDLEAAGVRAAMIPFDAEADHFDRVADCVRETLRGGFGRTSFDQLIHSAGIGIHAPFTKTPAQQLDRLYRIHVRAPYVLTQALLPEFADGGQILLVSSAAARFTLPGYAPMKGAVEMLARHLAKELSPRIRVMHEQTGVKQYEAPATTCLDCPTKSSCTDGKQRSVRRLVHEEVREKIAALAKTEAFA